MLNYCSSSESFLGDDPESVGILAKVGIAEANLIVSQVLAEVQSAKVQGGRQLSL